MREQETHKALEEARHDHASEIIDFLAGMTGGDLLESLSIARAEYEDEHSALWLAVCDGLAALIRQDEFLRHRRPSPYRREVDELPF